jgi:PilZ domain
LVQWNRRKFEAVIVDLQLGEQANAVLGKVRSSPSNRTAVMFTVSDSDAETAGAFKSGSNVALRRPRSLPSIGRSLQVAHSLILRERRRYFRCPVKTLAVICGADMSEIHGETLNISENGMAIASPVALAPAPTCRGA